MDTNCHVVIPCAGTGSRIGGEIPKQFRNLGTQPIVNYSLNVFLNLDTIKSVWVGVSESIFNNPKLMGKFPKHPKLRICKTGKIQGL
jgi:2-C-methyl-D-erythritol 4-phosphate cytidylyltransferase